MSVVKLTTVQALPLQILSQRKLLEGIYKVSGNCCKSQHPSPTPFFFSRFIHLLERQSDKGRGRDRDLASIGSFPKCELQ